MTPLRTLLGGLILAAATAVPAAAATSAAPAAGPAEWRTYDVLVSLRDLPRTYSCDELWYKFRDVLLQLGARAYMTLTPYECGYVGGGEARSPSVEAKFALPWPLRGAARRYAEVTAVTRSVRLQPGTPRSLQTGDCELVRQLRGTLLAALPVNVTASDFSCQAPRASFALTVSASLVASGG